MIPLETEIGATHSVHLEKKFHYFFNSFLFDQSLEQPEAILLVMRGSSGAGSAFNFFQAQQQFHQNSFSRMLDESEDEIVHETQGLECHEIPTAAFGFGGLAANSTTHPTPNPTSTIPPGRQYASKHWTAHELMVLQAAKKEDDEIRLFGGGREKMKKKEVRWNDIEEYCWRNNVRRSAKACMNKWDTLAADFKKINDYERQIPSGRNSYWQMANPERKDCNLPLNFFSDVYEDMERWYGMKTAVNPGGLVSESSIPASFTTPITPSGNQPDVTQEEEDVNNDSPTDGDGSSVQEEHSSGKKRGRVPRGVDGWINLMQKSEETRIEWRSRQESMQKELHAEQMNMQRDLHEKQIALKEKSLEIAATAANALQTIASGFMHLCQNSGSKNN